MSEHKIRERNEHLLGDAPIQLRFREQMNKLARALDIMFNGRLLGPDRKTGFVLLVYPYNDHSGRCNYISNGASREDIVVMMKEQIKRFEGQPEQEGHA